MDEIFRRRARNAAISSKQQELRKNLWPEVQEDRLWNRKSKKGFTTIPRTMPLFMNIMDGMSKGKPVSAVYLDLWCRAFDEHLVTLNDKEKLAFWSGFTGQRATQTWKDRLKILNSLGFIKLAPGPYGESSYALIMNPYKVVKDHHEKKTPNLTQALYNALLERAGEIKADDM